MTDKVLVSNKTNTAPDAIESFYSSPSSALGTKIKAFSATNSTEASIYYKAYIYSSTGDLVSAVIPLTIVVRDRLDYGAGLIGQVIPAGGTLRMESSDIGLNFYVTGVEQSVS